MQKLYLKLAVSAVCAFTFSSFSVAPVVAGEDVVITFEPGFIPPSIGASKPTALSPTGEVIELETVSNDATNFVTQAIEGIYAFCSSASQTEYMVDCLGAGLADVADQLPDTGDYAEARAILEDASQKLRALATANKSTTLPKARLSGTIKAKPVRTKRLTPVKTPAISSTGAQAAAILEEAETLLLRSVANSDRRKVHYAQMAQAVGSQTILLRSL